MNQDNDLPTEVQAVQTDEELTDISDRLQDMNQTIQEQAFLLGYRNGYREGETTVQLMNWLRNSLPEPPSDGYEDGLLDVQHFLAANGAHFGDDEDGEITYPPGLTLYVGASNCRPMVQVAGERVNVRDFTFDWQPNEQDADEEAFDPENERAQITLDVDLDLPDGSEQRAALMQFLRGLQGGDDAP